MAEETERPWLIVMMGVSGAGKTTIGRLLAERLGWAFLDADDFHPPANIRKMASGQPLDDQDRRPWLEALRREIDRVGRDDILAASSGVVLACSALREAYRQILGLDRQGRAVVFLTGDPALLASRLESRDGHFMPARLLNSQFEALEPPGPGAFVLDVADPPQTLVERLVEHFGGGQSDSQPTNL